MSLDPSAFPRSNSPASSESSLTRSRLQGKEGSLIKDKNYRRYASSVERALSLFDNALQEWADYISFLGRLLKALQTHPPDQPVVPHKVLVSKRLAQCLNPSLPSGVHQKTLEVYTYIFGLIKLEGLSHDLPLYLPGLAPTLTFASLTVRPLFLSLVEGYIVDVEPWAIRPALKAIILALLPGLEEETSDDFEPTLRTINKLRDAAGQLETQRTSEAGASGQYFWQCLFLASITNPSRRLGVLAYLNRYLPKLGIADRRSSTAGGSDPQNIPPEILAAADSVILPEPGLLIRCVASGLYDDQLLVQRNFLDLLVTHLPLSSPILQSKIAASDLQTLVIAAVGVVTRRDMSLNRRLWAWFLGPDPPNDSSSMDDRKFSSDTARSASIDGKELTQSQYFSRLGLQPLVTGLLDMIKQAPSIPSDRTKPFRIALSLMDRWEIGGYIVPAVFLPTVRSVQAFESTATKNHFEEVFRSASAFFDGVESGVIFSELLGLIDYRTSDVDVDSDQVLRDLDLAQFIIENFNVREEDMVQIHVPLLTLSVLVKMREISSKESTAKKQAVTAALNNVLKSLTGLLTERAFSRKAGSEKTTGNDAKGRGTDILETVHGFYEQSKNSLELPPLPYTPKNLGEMIIREAHELAIAALGSRDGNLSVHEPLDILVALLKKLPKSRVLRDRKLYEALSRRLGSGKDKPTTASFSVISTIASTVTSLFFIHTPGFYVSYEDACDLITPLVNQLWWYLSPLSPKFHVEAVRCLWLLHSISWIDHLVEASLTALMVNVSTAASRHLSSEQQAERFYVLWNHSHHNTHEQPPKQVLDVGGTLFSYQCSMLERPLFIVLDLLSQESSDSLQSVQLWLQDLPSIHKVFHVVISNLDELSEHDETGGNTTDNHSISPDDYKECDYLLQTASNIISALSQNGWVALLTHVLGNEKRLETSKSEENADFKSLHSAIFEVSLRIVSTQTPTTMEVNLDGERLHKDALQLMRQLLLGPGAEELVESGIDNFLVERLLVSSDGGSIAVQGALIDALLAALKVRFAQAYLPPPPPRPKHLRAGSRDRLTSPSILSFHSDKGDRRQSLPQLPQPPERLLDCLLKGISSPKSREIVDKWIVLLCEVLPLYSGSIFQILLMLVECFCREIRASYGRLQLSFQQTEDWPQDRSEHVTIALLSGLETCIANAHERLILEESNVPAVKSPDQAQGFFGNMVSGVFNSEGGQNRPNTANDRLTVLLCFQDAVRLCFSIWAWGAGDHSGSPPDCESLASFQYTSLRMRNRSRRILEHFFTAEALECLETLVEMWSKADTETASLIFNLLHTLDGSSPKITIPAIFNAIYTRTNPSALDPSRKSSLTSNLSESELASFLVTYARSLDDDVLDEIWTDCTTFLRDVLSNPFPHRQILPRLIEFAAILGVKLENTTFGEDRRMRKELGDVLLRLLTAVFTSKPLGLNQDNGSMARSSNEHDRTSVSHTGPDDMLSILAVSMPSFITTLGDSDRINTAITGVSTNVVGPLIRSRLFPNNLNRNVMVLLQQMAKVPAAAKMWKKDISDAFNDARFFGLQLDLVKTSWMDLLRQWVLADKERLSELLVRLPPPSSAGIMFGVGASAARLEADRKAQLNLRRIALLVLSASDDYFVGELPALLQKLEDLLAATSSSSPSSATRAEVFMVLRAVALKTSASTMAPFWPLINTELQEAISTVPRGSQAELYNSYSLLQACKLLDVLLVLAPDDFQLLEWLFVTDTIDAVYPPDRWEPIALADEVSQTFGPRSAGSPTVPMETNEPQAHSGLKRPWLISDWIRETAKDEIIERVLRPFFARLSIYVFESTYGMGSVDVTVCRDDLLADLFNESTMAN
ncbi:Armadillo-like helical [Penicillium cf. griseofulvum]|uniref:Armadillo-like helical n=1 Tax=Penicillium cf. griseofulvum TaxID=2972120 RepID=A0A9W9J3X4_9EURO|nr:Armadillo-like helical [Penicillium cf. griseofulvum]KAJ5435037.1 Armadillo-like helical [Penicillium cf. griseofulvum]